MKSMKRDMFPSTILPAVPAYKAVTNTSYHDSVLFVGQDIDPVVAKMCYIQLRTYLKIIFGEQESAYAKR